MKHLGQLYDEFSKMNWDKLAMELAIFQKMNDKFNAKPPAPLIEY